MQAIFNITVLAERDDIVMVDGNPYFPRASMETELFRKSDLTTSVAGKARPATGIWWLEIK